MWCHFYQIVTCFKKWSNQLGTSMAKYCAGEKIDTTFWKAVGNMWQKPFDPEMCPKGKIRVVHKDLQTGDFTSWECYFIIAENDKHLKLL